MLGSKTRSAGNAVQVTGYRLGLIIGGGVLLIVMDYASWSFVFFTMIGLIALNTLPILLFKEPIWVDKTHSQSMPQSDAKTEYLIDQSESQSQSRWIDFFQKMKHQFGYFWSNTEMRAWLLVLLVFKIADYMSSGMVKPMMVDMGFSLSKIGFWGTIVGSLSSLVGAILAAWLMRYMRRMTALVVFNALQALTTGLYAIIAWLYAHHYALQGWELFAANAIEHTAAAMAMVGLLTVAMDYARSQHAGSDFTFQVCAMTVLSGLGYPASGYLASNFGYTVQFGLSAVLGLILLLPILRWGKYFSQTHTAL
jgi:MFS transporter, PAT family, beta-lactamase induction signal transducer AmpG